MRIEDGTSLAEMLDGVDRRADRVPDVGVLGDDPQRRVTRAADQDRRMRALGRLRVAARALEQVVAPVEVADQALATVRCV
jgi:hypothetical protein